MRGLELHFAWLKGRGPRPLPLLLLHGWPGSTFEMIKVAGSLADPAAHGSDPADAFDLVIPSLPGHGFSEAPSDPLFGADDAADVLRDLMVDVLGYARFGAQGGDRGAFIAAGLAAWIVEKWCAWSDCEGDVLGRFTREELLTNVMLYWVSGCIRSFRERS